MTAVAQLPTLTPSVPQSAATVEISTSTPMSANKLYVKTIADNVNLRVNPGRLFQVSRILTRGSRVEFLGIVPNGQWLKVRT
ncbi:MAG: SH3 domain-containing protein, partial [Chloroflexota bacterium]